MKFGIVLPNFGPQAGRLSLVDHSLAAESLGFESAWLTDHIALPQADAERFGTIFESITTLTYLAGCTRTLKLGISSLVLPQRNPLEVAKQLATADVLSGGRVLVAVGVGWSEGEYRNLGYDFHNRGKRMDEAVKVLRTVWRGGSVFSFQGKYYSFDKAVVSPGPVQAGGPPLWIGGDTPPAVRRAVLLADGWHPNHHTPEELDALLNPVRPLIARRPFTVSMRTRIQFDAEPNPEHGLLGAPEQIIAQLRALQAVGVNHAILTFQADTPTRREAAMRRFVNEVMPALR